MFLPFDKLICMKTGLKVFFSSWRKSAIRIFFSFYPVLRTWLGLIIFSVLLHSVSYTQDTTFINTYGGENNDHARAVIKTYNGGYLIAGSSSSFGNNSDIYVIQVDSVGKYQWSKTYGGSGIEWGYSIAVTSDSNYVIAGITNSFGNGGYDGLLIKIDSLGNLLWQKTFGGTDWDFIYSVEQTNDSGFILAGETYSFGNGNKDVYLVKTDSDGDIAWSKTFGGTKDDFAKSVKTSYDSGYIITGGTESFGAGGADIYLIKTNSTGDTLWTRTYGGINEDAGSDLVQTPDTGMVVTGLTTVNNSDKQIYLFKIDINGNFKWDKILGIGIEDDIGHSIVQLPSGYFGLLGYSYYSRDFLFYLTNGEGWVLKGATLGLLNEDEGFDLALVSDSEFFFVGSTNSGGAGMFDVLTYRVNASGITDQTNWVSVVDTLASQVPLSAVMSADLNKMAGNVVFPNPCSSDCSFRIDFDREDFPVYVKIYDVIGKEVLQSDRIFETEFKIDLSPFTNNIYYFVIHDSNMMPRGYGKIVIAR